jgi:hypothetical protein
LSVWRQKKNNQRTTLSIYIIDTIESESTTRFKNRSSDRMMTSDWLVDVSDDRYTTTYKVTFLLQRRGDYYIPENYWNSWSTVYDISFCSIYQYDKINTKNKFHLCKILNIPNSIVKLNVIYRSYFPCNVQNATKFEYNFSIARF